MPDPVLCSLLRINRIRMRVLRQELAPYGYSGVMHLIVRYVSRYPGASQDDIAAFYALDKTGVARDARRLEELGHIRRTVHPENRRKYQLHLTEEGSRMTEVICRAYDAFAQALTVGVSPGEWEQLRRLLQQLEQNALSL